jgi:hypothetical protein
MEIANRCQYADLSDGIALMEELAYGFTGTETGDAGLTEQAARAAGFQYETRNGMKEIRVELGGMMDMESLAAIGRPMNTQTIIIIYLVFYKKHFFFTFFYAQNKAKPIPNAIYSIGGLCMRKPRMLAALVWYWVITAVNRHEPLFLDRTAVDLFNRVLREAGERFAIEVRRLVIEADRVSFCIKPADGFMLPEIMQ